MPHWQGRVSPVLDVAGRFLLVTLDHGQETARQDASLEQVGSLERARRLAQFGAETVICGAISRPLELALRAVGIEVIPHICGQVEDVLKAFVDGRLNEDAYLMPGCCGRRRRARMGMRHAGRCRARPEKGGERDAQG